MGTNPTKFLGAITASSWSFSLDENPPSGAATITITDGTYYLSGDDTSDDLLKEIQDQMDGAGFGNTFDVTIDSDGIVSIACVGVGSYTITWTSNGTTLRDILRFSGATTNFTDTAASGSQAARYFAHTDRPTRIDVPIVFGRMSMSEADDGTLPGVDAGPVISRYLVQVRYTGPHRTTTANGHTEFLDFFRTTIKPIRKFRWYPDNTVTTAYAELTNPFGYHVVKERRMNEYRPREVIRNSYTWYFLDFDLQVQP